MEFNEIFKIKSKEEIELETIRNELLSDIQRSLAFCIAYHYEVGQSEAEFFHHLTSIKTKLIMVSRINAYDLTCATHCRSYGMLVDEDNLGRFLGAFRF